MTAPATGRPRSSEHHAGEHPAVELVQRPRRTGADSRPRCMPSVRGSSDSMVSTTTSLGTSTPMSPLRPTTSSVLSRPSNDDRRSASEEVWWSRRSRGGPVHSGSARAVWPVRCSSSAGRVSTTSGGLLPLRRGGEDAAAEIGAHAWLAGGDVHRPARSSPWPRAERQCQRGQSPLRQRGGEPFARLRPGVPRGGQYVPCPPATVRRGWRA